MLLPIEAAHVRIGTDGATAMKPSDRWVISLCQQHHAEQHSLGEAAFEKNYDLNLIDMAQDFALKSPHIFTIG